jgi:hypothetical protein
LKLEAATVGGQVEGVANGGEDAGFAETGAGRSEIGKCERQNVTGSEGADFKVVQLQIGQLKAERTIGLFKPLEHRAIGINAEQPATHRLAEH